MDDGTIFSMTHPVEVKAAELIVESVPCAEMVRFLKSGAEATSAAIRIARAYTGKEIVLSSGYHGWHDTWCALNPHPIDAGVPRALKDRVVGFKFGDIDALRAAMNAHKGETACIIMEPVEYTNTDSREFLLAARELADENGVVLVFDEIVSGFRVALAGAQEYFGVVPDIACFAKGISNGLPLSVVAGKKDIMSATKDVSISSTYAGDALSLAAAVACIKEYREKDVISHLWECGGMLVSGMNKLAAETGLALEFKGYPQMSAYNFGYDDPEENTDMTSLFLQEMAARGILLRRGGLVCVTYSHKKEDIEKTLDICGEVFPKLLESHRNKSVKRLLQTDEVAQGIRRF